MLCVLSPAKTLDYEIESHSINSEIIFKKECLALTRTMKKQSIEDIRGLMGVSENIASLNHDRYKIFSKTFEEPHAKTAIKVFKGDVYIGLDSASFNEDDLQFSQNNLRILSGLYGLIKPLDLIQPYRLEMGISLKHLDYNNLYQFWDKKITNALNKEFKEEENPCLINLASNEYFKSIQKKSLKARIINIHFKDTKNGVLKVISFYAKKARGMMARYIVLERVKRPEDLKDFTSGGYAFNEELSAENDWVFTR
ncbi:peroxide stress protein YaaA [bacterium]|nr:peroxide stress protein YaaA [bacterium]